MALIDKDLLKEELNARIEVLSIPGFSDNPLMFGEKSAYLSVLSFLDTLEVKEVDLEKEVDLLIQSSTWAMANREDFLRVAKHFFELGIKSKGE